MAHQIKNRLLVIVLFSAIYNNDLIAQISPNNLSWSDFKGKVDNNSPYDATTYWGVNYRYTVTFKSDTAHLQVKTVYFLKDSSWVKRSKTSERLLNHERGHFKFAELLSLDFIYEASRKTYLRTNYQYEIDSLFKATYKKYIDMEIRYDTETKHFNNADAQIKWDEFLENRKSYFESLSKLH